MTYSRALFCQESMSPVYYDKRHWTILELNRNNDTAVLIDGAETSHDIPIKDIRE